MDNKDIPKVALNDNGPPATSITVHEKKNPQPPAMAISAPMRLEPSPTDTTKKKVEIAPAFQNKSSGRIGRNVHRRHKARNLENPDDFRKMVEAEEKLKHDDDKDRQIIYTKEGKPLHRPKTQEEMDKELAELLWRVNLLGRMQSQWSDWEYRTFKNRVVFYDLCIRISLTLFPILFLLVAWDFCCVLFFEIPHLSTLAHPGFVIPFHFFATPAAMYGYMMKVLHFEKSRLTKWGLFCVICHPILLIIRCVVEIYFNGYRDERNLRYEYYLSGVDNKPENYDPDFDYDELKAKKWKQI